MTKMAILGRGSFRDKAKEEELRRNPDPKYGHLQEDLHVEVIAHAPPAEAYARIAYALTEIRRYLVPDHNDEIRQEQMREMQVLNGRADLLGMMTGGGNGGLTAGIGVPAGVGMSVVPPGSMAGGLGGNGGVGMDGLTESSGSISPPSSISPPPTGPVKIPPTADHQLVAHAHAHAHAQLQMQGAGGGGGGGCGGAGSGGGGGGMAGAVTGTGAGGIGVNMGIGSMGINLGYAPGMPSILTTHPAMRGLTRTQMGLLTTTTHTAVPGFPPVMGRFPPLLPMSSVPPLPTHSTALAAARSLPIYEEYSDITTSLQTDFDASLITDPEKKEAMLKTGSRGRFRHEPYRRLSVNVPS